MAYTSDSAEKTAHGITLRGREEGRERRREGGREGGRKGGRERKRDKGRKGVRVHSDH